MMSGSCTLKIGLLDWGSLTISQNLFRDDPSAVSWVTLFPTQWGRCGDVVGTLWG